MVVRKKSAVIYKVDSNVNGARLREKRSIKKIIIIKKKKNSFQKNISDISVPPPNVSNYKNEKKNYAVKHGASRCGGMKSNLRKYLP